MTVSALVARRIRERAHELPFARFFRPDVALVPVPSHARKERGALDVPKELAQALAGEGLGYVLDCLVRIRPVPKAAFCLPGERPRAEAHFSSMAIESLLLESTAVLLIDDVITRGATLLGAASRILAHFPRVRIRAFAAMRTVSNPEDFGDLWDPQVGQITLRPDGETWRQP